VVKKKELQDMALDLELVAARLEEEEKKKIAGCCNLLDWREEH
jgi:hypothetical protein